MASPKHTKTTGPSSVRALRAMGMHAPLTAVLASLPLMLFAGAVVYALWQQQQHQFEIQQRATVRAIAVAIEKEIAGTVRQLQYMAASPLLDGPGVERFAPNARRALETTPQWSNVIVFGPDARQLLNARFPVPTGNNARGQRHVKTVLETGEPRVSDLFVGPASGRQVVAVTVPVMRGGRAVYALSVALDFAALDSLVKRSAEEGAVVVGVWDGEHQFVTRSIAPEVYRSKPPVPALVRASLAAREGWMRTRTIEGSEVFSAWVPIPSTGWSVGIAVSSEEADALLRRYLWALAIAEALILFVTVPLALKIGREARERAQAEEERDRLFALEHEARAAAETASRAKDEFLAMLGHELRNPLAAVSNAVQLLGSEKSTPEAVTFARGVIARQTAQLTRLIDDLLDVGRVITGKIFLQTEVVDLAAVTGSALAGIRAAGRADAHRLTEDVQPVSVRGDRTRLEQIVINLVSNALTYTPAGGSVHVALRREDDNALLTIRDNGIGLAPGELARVFELFYQAKGELHRKGGLGIGLTLVRRLVELHGGSVAVRSDGHGAGAEFVVRLPAVEAAEAAVKSAEAAPPATGALSILLIEDNHDARQSLAQVLALEGHQVHEAADGVSGVDAAARVKPDIALVDIGLPNMDGYEVARTLRARSGRAMTLVALTGYGQQEDERRAREAGFDAHLVKPAPIERLREVLVAARR